MSRGSSLGELIRARRMCRSYSSRSVPRAHLERILEMARRSPSAGHSQGARFGVVLDELQRREIAELYGESRFVARGRKPWLSVAPVHLVIGLEEESYRERYSEPDKSTGPDQWSIPYPILDVGQALMTLYLAAEDFGLAAGFLGSHAGPDLVQHLGLPESWRYIGLVTLGYRSGPGKATRSQLRGWRASPDVVRWL